MLARLPVDYSTLKNLLDDGCVYIDKTRYAYELITQGRRYFLSRPRRFGKSLFVSTLYEILRGNKALFQNLWIGASDYAWESHAVIKLDFSEISCLDSRDFSQDLKRELVDIGLEYGVEIDGSNLPLTRVMKSLISALSLKYKRVAVLIDEYDKPLIHNLHDLKKAAKIRAVMHSFFSVIKAQDAAVQFVFITGVSAFTKAGIFSGINNLRMLTLNKNYEAICGYTDDEIETYLKGYIQAWADKEKCSYQQIRDSLTQWYDGYHFSQGGVAVYNPFSLINALEVQEFQNFWFGTGTPTFLVDYLRQLPTMLDVENLTTDRDLLDTFDIDSIPLAGLLFQSGYATIKGYADQEKSSYKLGYANREVEISFQKYLLAVYTYRQPHVTQELSLRFKQQLIEHDVEGAVVTLQHLFAHVPHLLHDSQEKYYHSLLHMICISMGIESYSEYLTSHGRIDMVLKLSKTIYVIEIKFNSSAQDALAQIMARRYHEQFLAYGKDVILLGLSFNKAPKEFYISYSAAFL